MRKSFAFILVLWGVAGCQDVKPMDVEGNMLLDDNISIYYRQYGNGSPVIIVHGGPSLDHTYLLPHLDELGKDFLVTYYDQRACGKSSWNVDEESMTVQKLIEDINALADHLKYDSFHLLAHSWGGFIAMKYAMQYPERVNSLSLINSISANSVHRIPENEILIARNTEADSIERAEVLASEAFQNKEASAISKLFEISFRHQFKDEKYLKQLNLELPENIYERSQKFFLLGNEIMNYDFENDLQNIQVPALVVYGDYDPLSVVGGPGIAANIKDSRFEIIENCGHFPFIEKKEEFFELVIKFLKERDYN